MCIQYINMYILHTCNVKSVHAIILCINFLTYKMSMSALMIMVVVSMCVPIYKAHTPAVAMMAFCWIKIDITVVVRMQVNIYYVNLHMLTQLDTCIVHVQAP